MLCRLRPLKTIEPGEIVGEWAAGERWGKRTPVSGSIVFRADGTIETVNLPLGVMTGDATHLTSLESIPGKWAFEVKDGKRVVCLKFDEAKITAKTLMTWIEPKVSGKQWTFRQYIGDPDLMDIVEFQGVGVVRSR